MGGTFYKLAKWQIGNGEGVDVWRDNWEPESVYLQNFYDALISRVSDLPQPNPVSWNSSLLNSLFTAWVSRTILLMVFSRLGGADSLVWPFTRNGAFTVKSCYNKLIEVASSHAPSPSFGSVFGTSEFNQNFELSYGKSSMICYTHSPEPVSTEDMPG